MPKIGQGLFKKGNLSKKEHLLNEILHFCQKKGTKDNDFRKKFCQKKGTKTKSEKNCQKKGTASKKRHQKKGTGGVYNKFRYILTIQYNKHYTLIFAPFLGCLGHFLPLQMTHL